jgi:hypothetical protein
VSAYAVCSRAEEVLLVRWTGPRGPSGRCRARAVLPDAPVDFHGIQIVYAGMVIGGELCFDVDGSTDMAAWHPLADVPALTRVPLVDIGLAATGLS